MSKESQYAGFWRRLAAVWLDGLLVITVTAPILYLIYGPNYFYWFATRVDLLNVFGVWDLVLTRVLPFFALLAFWHMLGATPGKALMHCRIVDSKSRKLPSTIQIITRFLGYFASSLPLLALPKNPWLLIRLNAFCDLDNTAVLLFNML